LPGHIAHMSTISTGAESPLADRLSAALDEADESGLTALSTHSPGSRRDRFAALLQIYDLHCGALESVGDRARFQHHPAVAAVKARCEADWLSELERTPLPADLAAALADAGAAAAMRALAARDRLPAIYRWLARKAEWADVVRFLALEGGPDAGFDDLVATCQVGLTGSPKMELATNYWDEMGNGDPAAVHTTLHDQLVAAIDMPTIPAAAQPTSALERAALGGLLATNRWLQPEMLGALGLLELQAGPRCRLVLQAFDRCGAPPDAYPFYAVHAAVDPRHGKDWLDKAIDPTVAERPEWAGRIVRGAWWRSQVNARFLADVTEEVGAPVGVPAQERAAA
jgi:hypothetical protein